MPIEIHDLQEHLSLDLELLVRAVEAAAEEENPEVSVSIVDDAAIRVVNREHLGRDHATDVIAFDYRNEEKGEEPGTVGEIILSAETAVREARARGTDPFSEVVRYTVHGVLHLNGYDDLDSDSARAMWERQEAVLERLGFSSEPFPG